MRKEGQETGETSKWEKIGSRPMLYGKGKGVVYSGIKKRLNQLDGGEQEAEVGGRLLKQSAATRSLFKKKRYYRSIKVYAESKQLAYLRNQYPW